MPQQMGHSLRRGHLAGLYVDQEVAVEGLFCRAAPPGVKGQHVVQEVEGGGGEATDGGYR